MLSNSAAAFATSSGRILRNKLRSVASALALSTALISTSVPAADVTVTTIHSFDGTDGRHGNFESRLVRGPFGALFGVTMSGGRNDEGALFLVTASDRFHLLSSFTSSEGRGWMPSRLAVSDTGRVIGTTLFGGTHDCGTLFTVHLLGKANTIHSFDCLDGYQPSGQLVVRDGIVYGTTALGGAEQSTGNIYRFSFPTAETIYAAPSLFSDNAGLYWGVAAAPSNAFVAATMGYDVGDYHGSVVRVNADASSEVLHTFLGQPDGSRPFATPLVLADGTIYGTTRLGGEHNEGAIYRITPNGDYSVVYSFSYGSGSHPTGELTLGSNGRMYGVTDSGTIYEYSTTGEYRVLYQANFEEVDFYPVAGLTETVPGTFYGVSASGGEHGYGTIYKVQITD